MPVELEGLRLFIVDELDIVGLATSLVLSGGR